MTTELVWFRRDVRLDDNPAWAAGTSSNRVVPLFVIDPAIFDSVSERRQALLVEGLGELDRQLEELGGRLRVEHGDPNEVIPALVDELAAERVHVNREITPYGAERDRTIADEVELIRHEGLYVQPPGSIRTQADEIYRVFTPFYNSWSEVDLPDEPGLGDADIADDTGEGLPDVPSSPLPAGPRAAADRHQSCAHQEQRTTRRASARHPRPSPDC